MTSHLRRILGFALMPATSMIAPLLLLPTISGFFGPAAWLALGLGQGIGGGVSVVIGLAWPLVGGHAIASARHPGEAARIFRVSMYSRGATFLALLIPSILVVAMLVTEYRMETIGFLVATMMNGFSSAWYFAGTGRPGMLVTNEGFVRLAAYAITLGALLLGAPFWVYPLAMCMAGLTMAALNWISITRDSKGQLRAELADAWDAIRDQIGATMSRSAQAVFNFGAVGIYTAIGSGSAPIFSAVDQAQKALNNAATAWPTAFVSWVGGDPDMNGRRKKALRFFILTSALALASVPVWWLLGPLIMSYLFSGQLALTGSQLLLVYAGFLVAFLAKSLQLIVLVPLGHQQEVYSVNLYSSLAGILVFGASAWAFGLTGALVSLTLVHLAVLMMHAILAMLRKRDGKPSAR